MARIAGINLPEKRIEIALTYIYGIGRTTSKKILNEASIDLNKRVKELTADEENKLRTIIESNFTVEGDLRRDRMLNVKRLKDVNSYRGTRHTRGLPVRGQRTKTNSRTVRGNVRRTATSGKRTLEKT
ncbi:30S ribosomal protein S13 [Patescibacteria group bacterium]